MNVVAGDPHPLGATLREGLLGGRPQLPIGEARADTVVNVPRSGRYENVFTGATFDLGPELRARELFADFPVALLVRQGEGSQ